MGRQQSLACCLNKGPLSAFAERLTNDCDWRFLAIHFEREPPAAFPRASGEAEELFAANDIRLDYCDFLRDCPRRRVNRISEGSMHVRKVSAKELLGGKPLVMSANPAMERGFKKLQQARARSESQPDSEGPAAQDPKQV